jgi:hypothetical protein
MIVLSPSLVLQPELAAADLNAPVIGYRSLVTGVNIASNGDAAGFPVSNLANVSTDAKWRGADDSEQYLTITLNGAASDYFAVARHNFGSQQIAVSLEAREAEEDSWAEIVAEIMLADDSPLLMRYLLASYHSVRLKMASGNAAPQAAVVYVGELLVCQRRLYVGHTPIPFGRRTQVVTGMSESGNYLGRIITGSSLASAVSMQNLTPAWYRANLDPFFKAAQAVPFFFAWRPQQYAREVGFSWLMNDPTPTNSRANGMMSVDFEIGGIAT